MMFGPVVCVIINSFVPVDVKLFLCKFISKPIVTHIPSFCAFLSNIVVYKTGGGGIVGFNRSGRLLMAKSPEEVSYR